MTDIGYLRGYIEGHYGLPAYVLPGLAVLWALIKWGMPWLKPLFSTTRPADNEWTLQILQITNARNDRYCLIVVTLCVVIGLGYTAYDLSQQPSEKYAAADAQLTIAQANRNASCNSQTMGHNTTYCTSASQEAERRFEIREKIGAEEKANSWYTRACQLMHAFLSLDKLNTMLAVSMMACCVSFWHLCFNIWPEEEERLQKLLTDLFKNSGRVAAMWEASFRILTDPKRKKKLRKRELEACHTIEDFAGVRTDKNGKKHVITKTFVVTELVLQMYCSAWSGKNKFVDTLCPDLTTRQTRRLLQVLSASMPSQLRTDIREHQKNVRTDMAARFIGAFELLLVFSAMASAVCAFFLLWRTCSGWDTLVFFQNMQFSTDPTVPRFNRYKPRA